MQNTRLTCIEKAIECIIQQKSKKEIKCYIEIAVNVITEKKSDLITIILKDRLSCNKHG